MNARKLADLEKRARVITAHDIDPASEILDNEDGSQTLRFWYLDGAGVPAKYNQKVRGLDLRCDI